jgi:hypothetical protein
MSKSLLLLGLDEFRYDGFEFFFIFAVGKLPFRDFLNIEFRGVSYPHFGVWELAVVENGGGRGVP